MPAQNRPGAVPALLQRQRRRLAVGWKAVQQLGAAQAGAYARYRLGLRSGYYRLLTRSPGPDGTPEPAFDLPAGLALPAADVLAAVLDLGQFADLTVEADEILSGRVRLFGAAARPLELEPPGPLRHWTFSEGTGAAAGETDIKFTWEPARLGWAFTLGRAYWLRCDERYAAGCWQLVERFLAANPPYLGPNWSSAQEAALRLLALVFLAQALAESPHTTPARRQNLARAVAQHAARIPPTLVYARAQNNNHLLSEAAGLFTAGAVLPAHPQARRWREQGWRLFHQGLQGQIDADGAYGQHSANYHRLMLQEALWVLRLADALGWKFPDDSLERLAAATRWLLRLADPVSGGVPNLGPNDGAYILPLTACTFGDYRPVLQAAGAAFLGRLPFEPGPWDEMALWLVAPDRLAAARQAGVDLAPANPSAPWYSAPLSPPHVLRSASRRSWAYLRAARFHGRPGHADQLHLDLWWRGFNLALDAGTYSYNLPPPWDNPLACSECHNTLTVSGLDQMQRAGRFLYLDWAQAELLSRQVIPPEETGAGASWEQLTAQHDGYRELGLLHRRIVTAQDAEQWLVEDILMAHPDAVGGRPAPPPGELAACLHWLLPDWPWQVDELAAGSRYRLQVESPLGPLQLNLTAWQPAELQIVRAGEIVYGRGPAQPTWGWVSPTYSIKNPALALRLDSHGALPLQFTTLWTLPDG